MIKDYSVFLDNLLTSLNVKFTPVYSAYEMVHKPDTGWVIRLPELFDNEYILLHLQDFVTVIDHKILELETIENHYKDAADRIIVTHWNRNISKIYNGPINLIEFSSHNWQTALSLNDTFSKWQNILNKNRSVNWQCLNGRMCQHRRRAVDVLLNWDNGILSYGDQIPLAAAPYSNYIGCNNEENFIRLADIYGTCAVNIVTETHYDHSPGIVTEKTLMAFAAQQVPVVIGYQGIVQDCRELGFDMFDDLVDTSYDLLPNDTRVEQALVRNQKLICGSVDISAFAGRLAANREFLLEQFVPQMQQRVTKDITALVNKLKSAK